jgi:transposase
LSNYTAWEQKDHAEDWLLYPENIGINLALDETSLSNGELYTILSNKDGKGKKGTIVAMVKGVKSEEIISILHKIPLESREQVQEVTVDMAANMRLIIQKSFPKAIKVIDRFHVQKLAYEAVQEIRIKYRWEAIDKENNAIKETKDNGCKYIPEVFFNGDSPKKLLARSRYLLFKSKAKWTEKQKERAEILFENYPDLEAAYNHAQNLSKVYDENRNKDVARTKLALWIEEVRQSKFKSFNIVSNTINNNYLEILNYFDNRSTNAFAESFNAKIKGFRTQFRGVRDIKFFLFRLENLFA